MKRKIYLSITYLLFLVTLTFLMSCGAKLTSPSDQDVVTNLSVEKVEDGKVRLSWNYVISTNDTLEFWVARKTGISQTWSYIGFSEYQTKFYFDNINTNDSLVYAYKVAIYNSTLDNMLPFSDVVVYMSESTNPTNVTLEQIEQNKVIVRWHDRCVGEEGYFVDKKEGNGNWQTKIATLSANSTSYVDSTSLYQTFSYRIKPFYGTTSASGSTASITPILPAPSQLQWEQIAIDKIALSWTDNSVGEIGFRIDKQVANGSWQVNYGSVGENITYWVDGTAEIGQSLKYRIYAVFAANQYSDYLESGSIVPMFPATSNLSVVKLTDDIFRLYWVDHSVGEDGFLVQRKIGNLGWGDVSPWNAALFNTLVTGENVTSVDDDLSLLYFQSADISYRVRAFKGNFYSDWSEIVATKIRLHDIGGIQTSDIVKDICIYNYTAYLANNYAGVKLIDVSTPNNPDELVTYELPDRTNGVYAKGDILYALFQDGGFIMQDIEDFNNPIVIGSVPIPGVLNSIYVHGVTNHIQEGYAFIARGQNGLSIVEFGQGPPHIIGTITGLDAKKIVVPENGSYAFIAVGTTGGFRIVDITNPGNYSINYSYQTGGSAQDISVVGNYAYIANGANGLEIVDVSNISNPQYLSSLPITGFLKRIVIANQHAFVIDALFGLYVINISDNANPFIQGSYQMNSNPNALAVLGSYLYIADDNGIKVIQVFE
jgi:hypothetical protein